MTKIQFYCIIYLLGQETFKNSNESHWNQKILRIRITLIRPKSIKIHISLTPFNLSVKPIEARITSLRRTLSAGRRAELECTSAGSRPAARISWWIGTTQLANTTESSSPDRNKTMSILNFWPTGDHNNKYLGCRAENPMLPGQAVEDGWTLNVSCK